MSNAIDAPTRQRIQSWLDGNYDAQTKAAIQALLDANNDTELTDSFYKDLEFGTGGLRGIIGVGSNRMNRYTVGAATQGLANYLNQCFPGQEIKVAIAHDSRNMSPEFARIVADIFSANGIKVFLFKELRPTPELSFAIRHLGCDSLRIGYELPYRHRSGVPPRQNVVQPVTANDRELVHPLTFT